jgi:hypothetical protein
MIRAAASDLEHPQRPPQQELLASLIPAMRKCPLPAQLPIYAFVTG